MVGTLSICIRRNNSINNIQLGSYPNYKIKLFLYCFCGHFLIKKIFLMKKMNYNVQAIKEGGRKGWGGIWKWGPAVHDSQKLHFWDSATGEWCYISTDNKWLQCWELLQFSGPIRAKLKLEMENIVRILFQVKKAPLCLYFLM